MELVSCRTGGRLDKLEDQVSNPFCLLSLSSPSLPEAPGPSPHFLPPSLLLPGYYSCGCFLIVVVYIVCCSSSCCYSSTQISSGYYLIPNYLDGSGENGKKCFCSNYFECLPQTVSNYFQFPQNSLSGFHLSCKVINNYQTISKIKLKLFNT